MNVGLHIDQLILHGFDAADRDLIATVLERELAQLLAEQGVPPALAQMDQVGAIEGGQFNPEPDASTEEIGVQVARKIYEALQRPTISGRSTGRQELMAERGSRL